MKPTHADRQVENATAPSAGGSPDGKVCLERGSLFEPPHAREIDTMTIATPRHHPLTNTGRAQLRTMFALACAALAMFLFAAGRSSTHAQVQSLKPFSLPWNGQSPAAKALPPSPDQPAGSLGPITVGTDGHIYTGDQRLRLFGVNFSFGAAFPEPTLAPDIAERLSGFGFNCVRFHHMDMNPFPNGIRDGAFAGTSRLDPEALARLDALMHELHSRGIYSNLNLLVSRTFNAADGLPAEIEQIPWKDRHVVGFFQPDMIRLQKEYARRLLTHVNPHSGLAYKDDPAVAMVEINNENGLVHAWLGGTIDDLPELFRAELQAKWNHWLKDRYGSQEELASEWGVDAVELGPELLANGDFAEVLETAWSLEQHSGAAARVSRARSGPDGATAAVIQVTTPGTAGWHIQFNQNGLDLQADRPYTLRFFARSDNQHPLSVQISQAHDPWAQMGFSAPISLTSQWQEFEFAFRLQSSDTNARLNFSALGSETGSVEIALVSLRPGGIVGLLPGEDLATNKIELFQKSQEGRRTQTARLNWMTFLFETEQAYWMELYNFLKHDLGVRGIVLGTIAGCAPVTMMAELDAVDTHAYWKHPVFPGIAWDSGNWIVDNESMITTNGGVLNGLAKKRVFGKPHFCTEYNHPAPNTFSSEAPLLLAAVAALQDWDGIFLYSYKHGGTGWENEAISSFFDIFSHPTKMANVPLASALFLRGDMAPARQAFAAALSRDTEIVALRDRAAAWSLVDASTLGMPNGIPLLHQVGLRIPGVSPVVETRSKWDDLLPQDNVWHSDTRQLTWDLAESGREHVLIDTPKTKAVLGFTGETSIQLGEITLHPGPTFQNWNTVGLSLIEGDSWSGPARALMVTTAYSQNTGMQWQNAEMNTVGRNWGTAPVLIEPVPLTIELPAPPDRVQVWQLDPAGNREAATAAEPVPGQPERSRIRIPAEAASLWYEIQLSAPATRAASNWTVR